MDHQLYKKVVLVILDGFGVASFNRGNAIALAEPTTLNFIVAHYPSLTLQASGPLVGLPWGEMGNSEVGHLNIGAGRIVGQDLPRINATIQNGEFFKNSTFLDVCRHVKEHNSSLHLVGMDSSGGVHSLDEHLFALLGLARDQGIEKVYIHMFTDGRDTAEKVALDTVAKLKEKIKVIGVGEIATITGRFYAMDRGGHWEQTEATYNAIVKGVGETVPSAEDCIIRNYQQGIYDEMIKPTVITKLDPGSGRQVPVGWIKSEDGVIFFNFRPDRILQLVQRFVAPQSVPDLAGKEPVPENTYVVTMTEYAAGLPDVRVAFPPVEVFNNLASIISKSGFKQFHIAESEKYAHVTSFFNGGILEPLPGEERVIVTSPSNANNYADHPEMSANETTKILLEKIGQSDIQFYVVNFANPDMVGHTGNLDATVMAIKCVDQCLQKIMEATLAVSGVLIITADHGNAEQMINGRTGEIDKDHTTNPVPFLLIANEFRTEEILYTDYTALSSRVPEGVVSDVAPTILSLFGLPKPPEMTAVNLFEFL